jgi:Dolichyl-phosphate-mannose-protein mannosyltransferase
MDNKMSMPHFFASGPPKSASGRRTLTLLVAFYLLIATTQSLLKLLWVDELITFYISRQPGFHGVWRALQAGADPNPPLMHLLVKLSTAAFGAHAIAMRLPAILCVLLAIVAMWSILRRWVTPAYAAAGILAFMATRGFDYAYDARSYAPLMGFAMAALALWLKSNDLRGPRRILTLAGMSLALAAGISSNYYGVLAFFPIAVGEIVLDRVDRFRPPAWLALLIGAIPLPFYLPLIRHNIAEFTPHAWNRAHPSMILWSYLELVEGIFWPVLALAIIFAYRKLKRPNPSPEIPNAPEVAALWTLILYPFLGFLIAIAGAGMISPRCVAPVCCGFGLAFGVLAQKLFGGNRRAATIIVISLVIWVSVREGVCANILWEQRNAFFALQREVESVPECRILVGDSSFVLPLAYYSDPDTQSRIAFPIDFAAIHQFEPDDSGEQNLWAGRYGVFPISIGTLEDVEMFDCSAFVVARPNGWLAHIAASRGVILSVYGGDQNWGRAGGVFTPMAHPDTRILRRTP